MISLRYFCCLCLQTRSVILFLFFPGTYSHGTWLWLLVMYITWFLVFCYLTFIFVLLRKFPAYFIAVCGWKLQLWQYFCFRRVRKIAERNCLLPHVCRSVRMGQRCSYWRDFHKICCLTVFRKSVEKIQVNYVVQEWRALYVKEEHYTFLIISC